MRQPCKVLGKVLQAEGTAYTETPRRKQAWCVRETAEGEYAGRSRQTLRLGEGFVSQVKGLNSTPWEVERHGKVWIRGERWMIWSVFLKDHSAAVGRRESLGLDQCGGGGDGEKQPGMYFGGRVIGTCRLVTWGSEDKGWLGHPSQM